LAALNKFADSDRTLGHVRISTVVVRSKKRIHALQIFIVSKRAGYFVNSPAAFVKTRPSTILQTRESEHYLLEYLVKMHSPLHPATPSSTVPAPAARHAQIAVDCGKCGIFVYGIFFAQQFIGKCASPNKHQRDLPRSFVCLK